MTIQECYKKMGADYQEVLGRLHNEAMIGRFVRMFLQDDSFQILEEALRRGDVKEAFRGAHTLKGVCQNLGFSNLYAPAYALTETLRAGQPESRPTPHYILVQCTDGVHRALILLCHLCKLLLCTLQLSCTQGLGQGIGGRV